MFYVTCILDSALLNIAGDNNNRSFCCDLLLKGSECDSQLEDVNLLFAMCYSWKTEAVEAELHT